jgi:RNA polymerase sigma-70 factor (ECF subfamily)
MTPISLINESELLAKIAQGDQRAFRVIYDHYYNNVYAFALHLLKSDILAEETVQETFLKVWQRGQALNEIVNVESFLIAITRNHSLDLLRRNKLAIRTTQQQIINWSESHNETENTIILNETRRLLQNAIDLLPPQQKLVYQLCQQEGLRYEEAADKLNLSTLTVQSYMKLALRSVRKYMSKHAGVAALMIVLKLF